MVLRLKWEDKSYEELILEYPKNTSSIKWWCNAYGSGKFNINKNKYLKEFLIKNPPTFKISSKCCDYAKKSVAKDYNKSHRIDLNCIGVRKFEGGIRSSIKSCFNINQDKYDDFRPIFWYNNSDKEYYENHFSVKHSKCYTEYGLKRTGCCGCPYGRDFEKELEIIQKYEPKLYKACTNIFGESYEYTRKYREFVKEMKTKEKESKLNATNI